VVETGVTHRQFYPSSSLFFLDLIFPLSLNSVNDTLAPSKSRYCPFGRLHRTAVTCSDRRRNL